METNGVVKNKRGKVVHSHTKKFIVSMYETVLEDNPNVLIDSCVMKVAEMVGVGKRTVYKIIAAYKRDHVSGVKSPTMKKKKASTFEKIDDLTKCVLKRKVHEFFCNDENPSVDRALRVVNSDRDLPDFKRTTFFAILKELGFDFSRRGRNTVISGRAAKTSGDATLSTAISAGTSFTTTSATTTSGTTSSVTTTSITTLSVTTTFSTVTAPSTGVYMSGSYLPHPSTSECGATFIKEELDIGSNNIDSNMDNYFSNMESYLPLPSTSECGATFIKEELDIGSNNIDSNMDNYFSNMEDTENIEDQSELDYTHTHGNKRRKQNNNKHTGETSSYNTGQDKVKVEDSDDERARTDLSEMENESEKTEELSDIIDATDYLDVRVRNVTTDSIFNFSNLNPTQPRRHTQVPSPITSKEPYSTAKLKCLDLEQRLRVYYLKSMIRKKEELMNIKIEVNKTRLIKEKEEAENNRTAHLQRMENLNLENRLLKLRLHLMVK